MDYDYGDLDSYEDSYYRNELKEIKEINFFIAFLMLIFLPFSYVYDYLRNKLIS